MKIRPRVPLSALLLGVTLAYPAPQDSIRGFDAASLQTEITWEQQARSIPDPARIRAVMEKLSARPHLAGTPESKQTAEYLLAQLREFGLNAHIEQYESMLPQPKARSLEMIAPVTFRARLEEPAVAGDKNSADPGMIPSFNAFSGDGDVTAPLVYVNYGVPADYEALKERGIDVAGKIVIARYGGSWRGIKPKVAYEHKAVGCIIYSDPRDDGYFQGDAYPKGPFRPADAVQRGSVLDMVLYPGDPLSPGWASEAGSRRLPASEAATLMKIPVLPISAADAQPLLANLDGPVAPEAWRGALPLTYHLGSSSNRNAKVHLKVAMDNATRPLYNVIATIPGSEFPDEWILFGNHHDAWVHGASDPLSGASAQLETARALAELTRKGWKPRRTVMIGFWDGEEYGLIGSTEYMEKHADELSKKLVAYINSDSNGKGRLSIEGSHSLEAFMREVARDVTNPDDAKPLLDAYEAAAPKKDFRIGPLGSGSDYTPFLQHLGIASLNLKFESDDSGVYHSDYDDFAWYTTFSDKTFVHGRALSQLTATSVIRLADAPLLPFEFVRLASTIGVYLDEIEKSMATKTKVDLSGVRKETARLDQAANALNRAYNAALAKPASPQHQSTLESINRILYKSERDLTLDPGLPGRPWFRHRIYAPGMYTGYAVKTLPGIREAVELNNHAEAVQQAGQVSQVLQTLTAQLEQATKLLGGL